MSLQAKLWVCVTRLPPPAMFITPDMEAETPVLAGLINRDSAFCQEGQNIFATQKPNKRREFWPFQDKMEYSLQLCFFMLLILANNKLFHTCKLINIPAESPVRGSATTSAAAVLVSAIGNGTKYCCRDILHPNIVHRMPVNHRKSVSRVLRCYGKIAAWM